MEPWSARSSPTMQRASVDLPEPDSPDQRQRSALRHLEADAGNRLHALPAERESAAAPGEALFHA